MTEPGSQPAPVSAPGAPPAPADVAGPGAAAPAPRVTSGAGPEPAAASDARVASADGDVADGRERALDPRHVTVSRIQGTLLALLVAPAALVGAALVATLVPMPLPLRGLVALAGIAIAAWTGWGAWVFPVLAHRHTAYRVDDLGIEIRRGVWWRSVAHVPRSRIQHTDVSQGPLERRFGLATLRMFTAGTEHAEVALGGLEHGTALRIRDHLVAGGDDDAV